MSKIIAEIELVQDVSKPKTNGVMTGYTPTHWFKNIDFYCSGKHSYSDDKYHYPGEKILTMITFVSWEDIKGKIKIGDEFYVTEMDRIVGRGKILELSN